MVMQRLADISQQQKQIGFYGKTREVFQWYKVSGWGEDFYETHRADIAPHKAAKQHFDSLGLKKLTSMQSLRQECAHLHGALGVDADDPTEPLLYHVGHNGLASQNRLHHAGAQLGM